MDGDIVSPRVAIAEGAHFRGSVDMQRQGAQPPAPQKPAGQPAPAQAADTAAASGNAAAKPAAVAAQRVGA